MKVMSGTVVGGKVELPTQALAEGEHVMVVAPEAGGLSQPWIFWPCGTRAVAGGHSSDEEELP